MVASKNQIYLLMQMLQEWVVGSLGDRQSDSQSVIKIAWCYMKIFLLLTLKSTSKWNAQAKKYYYKYNYLFSIF